MCIRMYTVDPMNVNVTLKITKQSVIVIKTYTEQLYML